MKETKVETLVLDKDNNFLEEVEEGSAYDRILKFIPNELGINLCSVESISIERRADGQIENISIKFIPAD